MYIRIVIYFFTLILSGEMMSSAYSTPSNITLIASPKVLSIPIQDSHEPLVDIREEKIIYFWTLS